MSESLTRTLSPKSRLPAPRSKPGSTSLKSKSERPWVSDGLQDHLVRVGVPPTRETGPGRGQAYPRACAAARGGPAPLPTTARRGPVLSPPCGGLSSDRRSDSGPTSRAGPQGRSPELGLLRPVPNFEQVDPSVRRATTE